MQRLGDQGVHLGGVVLSGGREEVAVPVNAVHGFVRAAGVIADKRGEAAADGERQGATALSALQRVPPLRSWETPEESLTPRALDEMNNDGDP